MTASFQPPHPQTELVPEVPRDPWKVSRDNPMEWEKEGKRVERRELARLPHLEPIVELEAAVCRAVAGCAVCQHAITKGSVVLSVRVKLSEPRTNSDGSSRFTERFLIHAGCVLASFGGAKDLRVGRGCFDCGAEPEYKQGHPWKAFASSRHAPVPLCKECAQMNRWRGCDQCDVHYPPYMVSRVVSQPTPTDPDEEEWDEGLVGEIDLMGMMLCEYCASRLNVKTLFQQRREAEEFAKLRQQMAAGKVFSR